MKKYHLISMLLLVSACASEPLAVLPTPEASAPLATPVPSASSAPVMPSASPVPMARPSAMPSADVPLFLDPTPEPTPTPTPALSGPYVVAVTPNGGETFFAAGEKLRFSVRFSEPMDPESLKSALSLYVHQDSRMHLQTLSGGVFKQMVGLSAPIFPNQPIPEKVAVLSAADFDLTWNETQDVFTWVSRRARLELPTDDDPAAAPIYGISFYSGGQAHTLRAQSGATRAEKWFQNASNGEALDFTRLKMKSHSAVFALKEIRRVGNGLDAYFTTPVAKTTPWGILSAAHPQLNDQEPQRNPLNPANYRIRLYYDLAAIRRSFFIREWKWDDLDHAEPGEEKVSGTVEWLGPNGQAWNASTPQPFEAVTGVRLVPPQGYETLLSHPDPNLYFTLEILTHLSDAESKRLRPPASSWASTQNIVVDNNDIE